MNIKSFVDAISTDQVKSYNIISIYSDTDLFDGKINSYGYRENDIESKVENSREDVLNLRNRISNFINSHREIIFISYDHQEIISNIEEDPFFFRIATNTIEYKFQSVDNFKNIQDILDKVLPIPPEVSKERLEDRRCIIM